MSRYQRPLKRTKVGHPIDLDERLLDDLSRLFARESAQKDREAVRLYVAGDWKAGAAAELASVGLLFDSKEIAGHAFVRFRCRAGDEERNLAPWEIRTRERENTKLPWE